jgi:cell division septation protein DedD
MLGILQLDRMDAQSVTLDRPPEPAFSQSAEPKHSPTDTQAQTGPSTTEEWLAESVARDADADAASEFELVVGRRQVAIWLFVVTMALAITAMIAYLAGKATHASAPVVAVQQKPAAAAAAPVAPSPLPQASIVGGSTAAVSAVNTKAPLFADPEIGKVYIQVGAVSKGMAVILSEGLRSHGFESFVAPGPNTNVFRVLIGPLKDPQAFVAAQARVDAIELGSFARRYERTNEETKPTPAAPASTPAN